MSTEVFYSRTKNLGNYESETFSLKIQVSEESDLEVFIKSVKHTVHKTLGLITVDTNLGPAPVVDNSIPPVIPAEATVKAAAKKTTKKAEKAVEAAPVVEEAPLTLEQVKNALRDVWSKKGKEHAKDVLAKFNVEKSEELKVESYKEVVALCQKILS